MSSIIESIQKRNFLPYSRSQLPVSSTDAAGQQESLRRRLPSLSSISSSPATPWAFRRSKSVSSMGEYAGSSLRKWWDLGWSWILSRKPVFAKDLEMNEEETRVLGCHNKGSWIHVFYKIRSEIRRLIRSDQVGLPRTYR